MYLHQFLSSIFLYSLFPHPPPLNRFSSPKSRLARSFLVRREKEEARLCSRRFFFCSLLTFPVEKSFRRENRMSRDRSIRYSTCKKQMHLLKLDYLQKNLSFLLSFSLFLSFIRSFTLSLTLSLPLSLSCEHNSKRCK